MKKPYHAYLVRLWSVQSGNAQIWRISLEDAQTGQRHGFNSLDDLLAYLWQVVEGLENERYSADEVQNSNDETDCSAKLNRQTD